MLKSWSHLKIARGSGVESLFLVNALRRRGGHRLEPGDCLGYRAIGLLSYWVIEFVGFIESQQNMNPSD